MEPALKSRDVRVVEIFFRARSLEGRREMGKMREREKERRKRVKG